MTQPSTRILVLGAGIAGLLFTLRLAGKVAHESVQITLVDESDTFTERPRLHEFATNQHVLWRSLSQILRKTQVQFLQGRVTALSPSQHRITVQVEQEQPQELAYDYLAQAIALGRHHAIFFPLSPDDRPRPPSVTGWLGSLVREAAVRFVIASMLVQRRFPGLFVWSGKERYEQAQRRLLAKEEQPSLPVHHLS